MTMQLPPYPAQTGSKLAQLNIQRKRYRPAIERLEKALRDADAAFGDALDAEDARLTAQDRVRQLAFPRQQKRLG